MTNFDITKLKKAKKYKIEYIDVEAIVNNEYLWNFRNDNNITQARLANLLKVSKKTIEKWEQGKNPIKGTSAILIYLFSNHPELMKSLYNETRNYQLDAIEEDIEPLEINIKYEYEEKIDGFSYGTNLSKSKEKKYGQFKYAGI